MNRTMRARKIALALALMLSVAACGGGTADEEPTEGDEQSETAELTPVSVQLMWFEQAQFAGYLAADDLGFYEEEGLDVTVKPGGPDAAIAQLVASGDSEFGIMTLGMLMQARSQGIDLVSVAQYVNRPGYRLISFKDKGIESVEDLRGKKVGVWPGTLQVPAALDKFNVEENELTMVQQAFDMDAFLNGELDAASATTGNELAQVLQTGVKLDDLNMINFDELGTDQLGDGLVVNPEWLEENEETAIAFLRGTLRGWIHCRENPEDCVDIVVKRVPDALANLQLWQMNEYNKLIWPAEGGWGVMPEDGFKTTDAMLTQYGGMSESASMDDIWRGSALEKASADFEEDEVTGEGFEPMELDETFFSESS